MIYSMTGFGRGEYTEYDRKIIVEMKSVNHRYCDVNVRLPRKLIFLEIIHVLAGKALIESDAFLFVGVIFIGDEHIHLTT